MITYYIELYGPDELALRDDTIGLRQGGLGKTNN